jgi:hypothetical protein
VFVVNASRDVSQNLAYLCHVLDAPAGHLIFVVQEHASFTMRLGVCVRCVWLDKDDDLVDACNRRGRGEKIYNGCEITMEMFPPNRNLWAKPIHRYQKLATSRP